ncbi:pyruvate/2-oxoglutarate dehydrogenase complex, dihydrolipoamide dehydrogenase E3 component [Legionella oakridgensis ATCC 33761 = DSM 21215]|uniref:Pyruvate/2-oxoglutarate dehydrogenase complex, dihydrolipoamide dehydrogenase E3 component n=1 Tax=Legionella oakridgensis ATCC 33761 = DSM 21215 TaxID=1268635 RepID=W0BI61_9GAMM|nr:pyruvate/2-oxoglutarate dehydrogenase complex, dihydrolipoamide dehydrogenase E3 component [Legionella oakridgensis ATCC 33761 = DSM 21215]
MDRRLRTTNKNIYAMGDVVGDFQFTHIASYHSSIILRNILFWLPAKIDYRAVPWITYTSPELAHVGITSKEAAMRSNTQITTFPFAGNDRAQAEHASDGLIKAVSDHKGRILGITIVGANAGELLLPWVIAIRTKKTLRFFTDTVVPYPTFSELSKQVAGEYYKPKLFSKWVRCFVRLLLKIR